MSKYKAFISDFDGTLVGASRKASVALKKAVQDYVKSGGVFVVASGRCFQGSIAEFYREVGLSGHAIVRAGAEIIEVSAEGNHTVIWEQFIPAERARMIIDYLIDGGFNIVAESGEAIHTPLGRSELVSGNVEFRDIATIDVTKIPKILLRPCNPKSVVEPILEYFSSNFSDVHPIMIASPHGIGIDFTAAGVSKHSALFRLSKMIGVGDSYNDFPLLSACGLKIAMGNAPDELKSIADHIVGTQEEDGVIEALAWAR